MGLPTLEAYGFPNPERERGRERERGGYKDTSGSLVQGPLSNPGGLRERLRTASLRKRWNGMKCGKNDGIGWLDWC